MHIMIQASLLKFADRWLGSALAQLLPRPAAPPPQLLPPRTILLIRPGGIGDAVLLVPAIQILREHFPLAAIDVLAESRNAGAFALCPGIRNLFRYDRPGQVLAALRQPYDVVIDTEQWHRLSAVIARLVRAPVKIGFATNQRRRMFTHAMVYRHDDYELSSFLHLLEPLGITAATPEKAWLSVPAPARHAVTGLLSDVDQRPLVAIFPGASIAEKHWAAERFRAVTAWCLGRDLRVVLVGGAGDRVATAEVAAGFPLLDLAGRTKLAETAAVLERAAVVVSGDSGVLHIAAGLGRPTVALFGPSSPDKWAPQGDRHVVLRPTDCPSCSSFGYTPNCPHGVRCMREITVDAVTGAIALLMKC